MSDYVRRMYDWSRRKLIDRVRKDAGAQRCPNCLRRTSEPESMGSRWRSDPHGKGEPDVYEMTCLTCGWKSLWQDIGILLVPENEDTFCVAEKRLKELDPPASVDHITHR